MIYQEGFCSRLCLSISVGGYHPREELLNSIHAILRIFVNSALLRVCEVLENTIVDRFLIREEIVVGLVRVQGTQDVRL